MKLIITFFAALASVHMATAAQCQHGGREVCSGYRCNCPSPYSGTRCEHVSGNLRVFARYGHNLPDKDGAWNDSDPYMEVIAVDAYGRTIRKTTPHKQGDHSPVWNTWLNFGTRAWKSIRVRVYDDDHNADDALSSQQTWTLPFHTSRKNVRLNCHRGYVMFDYHFN